MPYFQVEEIARNISGLANTTQAIKAFHKILTNHSLSYFHDEPLPINETRGDAFQLCKNEETAKVNCPKRWKAMMKWFSFAQMVSLKQYLSDKKMSLKKLLSL